MSDKTREELDVETPHTTRGIDAPSPGIPSRVHRLATRGAAATVGNRMMHHKIARRFAARHADENGVAPDAEQAVSAAASSSGMPLPADIQRKFEGSLGADLSSVRVHTGGESAEAASAVSAKAYTVGNDIHFAEGQYQPHGASGMHLLAHEVAHTVQQSGLGAGRAQCKLEVSTPGDAHEMEADAAADAMVHGAPASVGDVSGLSRQVMRDEDPEPQYAWNRDKDVKLSAQFGRNKWNAETDKDGHVVSAGDDFDACKVAAISKQLAMEPPVYAEGSAKIKVKTKGEKHENGPKKVKASIVAEGACALGLGVAAKDKYKVGLEGQLKLAASIEVSVEVVDGKPHFGALDIPLTASVTIAAVAEAGKGDTKAGVSASRQLSSLDIAKAHWDGQNGFKVDFATWNDLGKAAKDLLENGARTADQLVTSTSPIALGIDTAITAVRRAIWQHKHDQAALAEFEANAKARDAEMEKLMSEVDEHPVMLKQTMNAYAEREVDCHEAQTPQIQQAAGEASTVAVAFNNPKARDKSWWQNGSYEKYNAGAVKRMEGNRLFQEFAKSDNRAQVKALGQQALAAYQAATGLFKEAKKLQFGQ